VSLVLGAANLLVCSRLGREAGLEIVDNSSTTPPGGPGANVDERRAFLPTEVGCGMPRVIFEAELRVDVVEDAPSQPAKAMVASHAHCGRCRYRFCFFQGATGLALHLVQFLGVRYLRTTTGGRSAGPFIASFFEALLLFFSPSCLNILERRSRKRKRGVMGHLSFVNLKLVGYR